MDYVFKKIKKILPYTFVSILFTYIIYCLNCCFNGGTLDVAYLLQQFCLENFFFCSVTDIPALNGPIWYLATMFLAMPFFLWVVRKKSLSAAVCLIIPVMFYTNTGMIYGFRSPFYDVIRAFCGMLLGTYAFEIIPYIRSLSNRIDKRLMGGLRICFFAIPLILAFYNIYTNWLILFCFVVSMALCMQQNPQYPKSICAILNWLGEISRSIYLMQYPIIRMVLFLFKNQDAKTQAILYYIITVVVSIPVSLLCKKISVKLSENKIKPAKHYVS